MGEFHPADRKVVVEFCPKDLPLTERQQLKLKKIAGARYNPEKDIIKISCERFEHQAQNKRYLGDLVDKMIATAKVGIGGPLALPSHVDTGLGPYRHV
jgi:small subunit ribosomal protein S35